ncbi:MAG: hypothetical protein WAV10_02020, partial [Minisyncoccia bacterium]
MSKRNLIILIIILITVVAVLFGFSYFSNINTTGTTGQTQGINFISQFFPSSKNVTSTSETTAPADVSGFTPNTTTEISKSKLNKVSSIPIAGYGVFMKERFKEVPIVIPVDSVNSSQTTTSTEATGTDTTTIKTSTEKPTPPPTELVPALRYVSKTTGNIYQTFADKIDERKFSGTIVPVVYEAFFGNNGESVIMRYLKTDNRTIETFIGTLPKETLGADTTGENELNGSFLPENITDISISSDTSKVFYLFNVGNTSTGITSSAFGDKKSQVFNSSFTEWLSSWPNTNTITVTTKPSANVLGYMYTIDPNKKDFNKALGDINGLTTLTSPNGKLVLYSGNTLTLNVYDINTRESTPLGLKTLPEKCVWNNLSDGVYC